MKRWTVYIIRCADGSLYTGIARDADKRLAAHRAGKGSRILRAKKPLGIVYRETRIGRSSAQKREAQIKRLTRPKKLDLLRKRNK